MAHYRRRVGWACGECRDMVIVNDIESSYIISIVKTFAKDAENAQNALGRLHDSGSAALRGMSFAAWSARTSAETMSPCPFEFLSALYLTWPSGVTMR